MGTLIRKWRCKDGAKSTRFHVKLNRETVVGKYLNCVERLKEGENYFAGSVRIEVSQLQLPSEAHFLLVQEWHLSHMSFYVLSSKRKWSSNAFPTTTAKNLLFQVPLVQNNPVPKQCIWGGIFWWRLSSPVLPPWNVLKKLRSPEAGLAGCHWARHTGLLVWSTGQCRLPVVSYSGGSGAGGSPCPTIWIWTWSIFRSWNEDGRCNWMNLLVCSLNVSVDGIECCSEFS